MTLNEKLQLLGYSKEWFEAGVLKEEALDLQIQEFQKGDDPNAEHYRYRTMASFFNDSANIEGNNLVSALHLLQIDQDKGMASSVAIGLLKRSELSHDSFQKVCKILQSFGEWTQVHIDKAELCRRWDSK